MTTTQSTFAADFIDMTDLAAEIERVTVLHRQHQNRLADLILNDADLDRQKGEAGLVRLAESRLAALDNEKYQREMAERPCSVQVTDLMH